MLEVEELKFYGESEIELALLAEYRILLEKIKHEQSIDRKLYKKSVFINSSLQLAILQLGQALQAMKNGNLLEVLTNINAANHSLGMAQGCGIADSVYFVKAKAVQRRAKDLQHIENREIKAQVIKYYKDNPSLFTSKDDAANKIAGKIVPSKVSTVRRYLRNI